MAGAAYLPVQVNVGSYTFELEITSGTHLIKIECKGGDGNTIASKKFRYSANESYGVQWNEGWAIEKSTLSDGSLDGEPNSR